MSGTRHSGQYCSLFDIVPCGRAGGEWGLFRARRIGRGPRRAPARWLSEAISVFTQHEIDEIETELAKFNEQIIEIEESGRQDPMIELLKRQAIALARHIDELRYSLCAKN
jgi:hypothetical protein